jgi:hypothetical protein
MFDPGEWLSCVPSHTSGELLDPSAEYYERTWVARCHVIFIADLLT